MPCIRLGCPYSRKNGEARGHGYCCNACRCGEWTHTKNCAGFFHHRALPYGSIAINRLPLGDNRPAEAPPAFLPLVAYTARDRLPVLRSPECAHAHIRWFEQRYGMPIEGESTLAWDRFILDWAEHWSPQQLNDPSYPVVFYALSRDRWTVSSHRAACPTVDVHALGLDATSHAYARGAVTGFHFAVQARLVQQAQLPDIVRQAMIVVRESWARGAAAHFVFVCSHGTHRSVGAALLALQLLCPMATLAVGTRRVQEAAVEAGFQPTDAQIIPF